MIVDIIVVGVLRWVVVSVFRWILWFGFRRLKLYRICLVLPVESVIYDDVFVWKL